MVLTTLAENVGDPKALLNKLREAPCFTNFNVAVAKTRFSLETAADFIKTVATTKGIEPPMVPKKLYLRVRLNIELKKYFNSETEILDFYQLCVVMMMMMMMTTPSSSTALRTLRRNQVYWVNSLPNRVTTLFPQTIQPANLNPHAVTR